MAEAWSACPQNPHQSTSHSCPPDTTPFSVIACTEGAGSGMHSTQMGLFEWAI